MRETAGTEVSALIMKKWQSRAPEKPGQFLPTLEDSRPDVGEDVSAQGCGVGHKKNQVNLAFLLDSELLF